MEKAKRVKQENHQIKMYEKENKLHGILEEVQNNDEVKNMLTGDYSVAKYRIFSGYNRHNR